MSSHGQAAALGGRFWSPGTWLALGLMAVAGAFILARYSGGLAAVTNLTNAYPWGIWIAIDVASGVALAAGGFTTAALVYIFGCRRYAPVTRGALLTALLGYIFVTLALVVDIGRSWAIWHPLIYWNPHSVLFEVAMCVMTYTTVLILEFVPVAGEGLGEKWPWLGTIGQRLEKIMWVLIIAGVVLSCMHQSGLGSLMLIAPTKVHPLWYTPILPLLFLSSAVAAGLPMVILEHSFAAKAFALEHTDEQMWQGLARIAALLLGIYAALKLGDMLVRGTYTWLGDGSVASRAFIVELIGGVIVPLVMLLIPGVRRSPRWRFVASLLVVGGVLLNRINVFLVGFNPPYPGRGYFPSVGEMAVTAGMIAAIAFFYKLAVWALPVLSPGGKEGR